jgi:hypothetical protein
LHFSARTGDLVLEYPVFTKFEFFARSDLHFWDPAAQGWFGNQAAS